MENDKALHIVMFPWLATGHLIPFLRLSKLLANKDHKITFISTPKNLSRLPKLPPHLSSRITFLSLPLPPVPGLPRAAESSADVPYNTQQRLKAAFDLLQSPVTDFLRRTRPDWVIYDYASHWLPSIAGEIGVSRAYFSLFNAATLSFIGPPSELISDSRSAPEDFTTVPRWIPFDTNMAFRFHEVARHVEKTEADVTGPSDSVRFGVSIGESDVVVVRSCIELEPEWFNLLDELYGKPVLPIGFLPPVVEDEDDDVGWVGIKEWLDKQRVESVVYVALGTEASLTREEISELALGLEKSNLPFVWVLRHEQEKNLNTKEMLPDGFEQRVEPRGVVLYGWVPQVKILSHVSVGCFLTHCGWNSVIEGLGFGRVLVLFPILNDQGLNARLLQGKSLGVEVKREAKDGSFGREAVAEAVRLAVVDEKGEAIRAKVREMKGLFGDRDSNVRYVDEFVRYLEDNRRGAHVSF